MPRVLVVHHTTSPSLQSLLQAVVGGCGAPELAGVAVDVVPALAATASHVLGSDGFVLGTPANIGYMSGALKHFFDQVYYPCLDARRGSPYGLYVHGNNDTTGACRAVESIAGAMGWERVAAPVLVTGAVRRDDETACQELGATVAARLLGWGT